MTVDKDMFHGATRPTMHVNAAELLRQLSTANRDRALETLTNALVFPQALEFADALGDALAAAQEAAVEPEAAVEAARQALNKEQHGIAGRMKAFWDAKLRADAGAGERPPDAETAKVVELRAALDAAELAAMPFAQRVRYHESQIAGLRAAPAPDPAALAVLAEALVGGSRDSD